MTLLSCVLVPFLACAMLLATPALAEPVRFADDVMPILKLRCVECHQPDSEGYVKSGLDLRTYEGLMKGTKYGPIVIPGNAMLSNLNVLVEGRTSPSLLMPHKGKKLTSCEIDILRRWVNHGALNN